MFPRPYFSSTESNSYNSGVTFPDALSSFILSNAESALPTAAGSPAAASSAAAPAPTTSVLATGNSPSWIATLEDPVISADMTAASAGGTVSETGMAELFTGLAAELTSNNTTLSASQLSDLKTIASDLNVGETASSYITFITDALILGNAANATWTGGNATATTLGDLTIGSTATQLSELTGKWFLGTDLPSDVVSMTGYPTFTVSYSADTAPLYSSGGPSISDVNQGYLGDCYLMACVAEVAHQNPSLITSMITANGNNSYGVRFVVDGAAEYVTVSNTLADGGTIFNSGPAIWASLIEQAYAQLQASGVVTGNNVNDGNSWSTIGNGGAPEYALAEITGATKITDFSASGSSWNQYVYNNSLTPQSSSTGIGSASVLSTVTSDLTANDDVILSSNTNAYASNGMQTLVADHAFSVYGYDSATGDLELRNPWGTESRQTWDTTFEVALSTLLAARDTITIDNVGAVATSTAIPTITGVVETPSSGDLNAGKSVTITLDFNAAVTVTGGTPTLTLNDDGTATYASGSGSAALNFSYTVGASNSDVSSLTVNAVNPNGATIADSAGNAQLSLSSLTQSGPQIDTTIPTATSIVEAPSTGAVTAGEQVVFTLNLTEAVTVSGMPSLTLNDGGVATFSGGSGSISLTFSYTVAASNSDVAALTVTAVNLNGGSIEDGAGNNANLALSGLSQTGPQVAEMSTTEIDEIYQAVLQRAPTAAEVATWLATEPPVGEAAIISALVDSPEARQYVYPVIEIIELATGLAPTSGQVDGWVNAVRAYVAQGETLVQALTAVAFAFTNDNTAFENEYGTTSTSIIKGIYANAFGTTPMPAQISAWSVDTPAENSLCVRRQHRL